MYPDPMNPRKPPTPSPWPGGLATTPVPGVGDFLCAMVKELRSLRAESGLPAGMQFRERVVTLVAGNPQQIVESNSSRRMLWLNSVAGGVNLTLSTDPTFFIGFWTLNPQTPLVLLWTTHRELCCQAILTTNGVAGSQVHVLEGIAPNR